MMAMSCSDFGVTRHGAAQRPARFGTVRCEFGGNVQCRVQGVVYAVRRCWRRYAPKVDAMLGLPWKVVEEEAERLKRSDGFMRGAMTLWGIESPSATWDKQWTERKLSISAATLQARRCCWKSHERLDLLTSVSKGMKINRRKTFLLTQSRSMNSEWCVVEWLTNNVQMHIPYYVLKTVYVNPC